MNWILAQVSKSGFWMPPQASTVAPDVDWVFYFIFWITAFFFLLILVLMLLFVAKYRFRAGNEEPGDAPSHSTALELTWTVIPTVLVLMIFYFGFSGFLNMSVVPPNAYEINVNAQMWNWQFIYPNGYVDTELHVPVNTPIRIVLQSQDVLHSFFVPQFRVKKDAVPGRYNRLWFQATETTPVGMDGKTPDPAKAFDIYCAEYCGTSHSTMRSKVYVHTMGNFQAWLEDASDWTKHISPLQAGANFVKTRGCLQCHSIDGTRLIGPSLKNVFGEEQTLSDGTKVIADENYIKESIYEPQAKIVQSYTPQMPSFKSTLKDRDVDAIIVYLKSISERYKNDTAVINSTTKSSAASAPATTQALQ